MAARGAAPAGRTDEADLEKMSAEVCVNYGEQLLTPVNGRRGAALRRVGKGEQAGDWKSNPRRQSVWAGYAGNAATCRRRWRFINKRWSG